MEKAKGLDKEVERYIVGFMFIILGVFIVSAVSYIASVIPEVLVGVGSYKSLLNPPIVKASTVLNSATSVSLTFPTQYLGTNEQFDIVWELTYINATLDDIAGGKVYIATDNAWYSVGFYNGSAWGHYFIWFESYKPTGGASLDFKRAMTGNITVYLFRNPLGYETKFNATDIAVVLGYAPPKIAVSNKLFINFIGWAFGVMFVAIGITRLGIKI
jgi:uncharacterized membrane protein